MAEDDASRAVVRSPWFRRLSPVWIIPLVVLIIGGWLLYQNALSRGPEVTLRLASADGLQADETVVKVRDVEVGRVVSVRLSEGYDHAIATLQMNPGTARLLVEDSEFWVVKPRVSSRGVSGLETILSGAYIRLRPGDSDEPRRQFRVPEQPPVSHEEEGLALQLTSRSNASLNVGDPVLYEGRPVGQVDRARFDTASRKMHYRVFVRSPYDDLVRENTRFWMHSGVEVEVGSQGLSLRTGTLQSLVMGGIAFGVLEDVDPGKRAAEHARFPLFASREAARQHRFDERIRYVALFKDSIRGLHSGAPVEYRGIRVGTVTEVPFLAEVKNLSLKEGSRIPVLLSIEPQRLNPVDEGDAPLDLERWRKRLRDLFGDGLHASIRPANLVTGAMYVNLQYGDTTSYEPRSVNGYPVFPSRPGGFTNLERRVTGLLENLNEILESDATRDLPNESLKTLREVRETLRGYRRGEPAYEELRRSLERLNEVLEDVGPLAETLRGQPSALIYGREARPDPVPRAPR